MAKGRTRAIVPALAVAALLLAACAPTKPPPEPPPPPQTPPESPAWSSPALDGIVQARPVLVGNVVVVATENDTLYGLDAADGHQLWQTHFAEPVPLSYLESFGVSADCGNIDPMGITGTPVVDTNTNIAYAVGEAMPDGGLPNPPDFRLVGVNVTSGNVVLSPTSIVPAPQTPPGMYTQVQLQRPRLALANGKVYASFGGLAGDCGTYNGFVVAANEANGTIAGFFKVAAAPNGSDYFGGAVWGTSGPLIDSSGNVYASTGNGFDNDTLPDPNQTDGVIKLSPTAQLLDWFQSPDWRNDNDSDFDLGSTGPLQLPNNKIFQIGKQGVGFLLDQSNLGGADHHTALASVNVGCGVFGSAVSGTSIFAACKFFSASVGIHQIVVNGNSLSVGWQSPVPANHPPTVDGSVVWAVADGGNTLYGLDAATGAVVAQHPFPLDPSQHFVTPVIMGNLVLVTAGNQVVGYDKTQTSSTQTHTSTTTSTTAASTTTATSAPATTTPATTPSTTSPSASTTSP